MPPIARLLIPEPSPVRLIRVGGTGDGAYLVPDDLEGIRACFSPGVNNTKDFEDELASRYDIHCYLCDYSSDPAKFKTPLLEGRQTFDKKWLEPTAREDSISLTAWVAQYATNPDDDLILQMDIEGAEYRNLLNTSSDVLNRFRIVVVELHALSTIIGPGTNSPIAALLSRMSETHRCVHAHPNNCCGEVLDPETGMNIPNVIELTYLRRDRFTCPADALIQPQIPHPDDVALNVRTAPPLHLNERWLPAGVRSSASSKKVLEDHHEFLSDQLLTFRKEAHSIKASFAYATGIAQHAIRNAYSVFFPQLSSPAPQAPASDAADRALLRPYFLTSALPPALPHGVVRKDENFFFHTQIGVNQAITVDLGESEPLSWLCIHNRTDAMQDRAGILCWIAHDTLQIDPRQALPVLITPEFLASNPLPSWTPLLGKAGRYLTVFSPLPTALHFADLRVY